MFLGCIFTVDTLIIDFISKFILNEVQFKILIILINDSVYYLSFLLELVIVFFYFSFLKGNGFIRTDLLILFEGNTIHLQIYFFFWT